MTTAFSAADEFECAVEQTCIEILPSLRLVLAMIYSDMPVIIPLLATGYLLTIYLLLTLAQRTLKSSSYIANSLTDAYAPYLSTEQASQIDEVERWSLRLQRYPTDRYANAQENTATAPLAYTPTGMLAKRGEAQTAKQDTVVSKELQPGLHSTSLTASPPQKLKEANIIH